MGQFQLLISDCDLSRFGAWCLLGPATTTLGPLPTLQEPAVRPTVFSDLHEPVSTSILLLPVVPVILVYMHVYHTRYVEARQF